MTAVKKKWWGGGGGGGGEVPFWPDRYERPRVLYVSTFGLDTKSGPQRGSGRPRYQQLTEALGPQGWTECLQDVSLWCPSPFGSILGVTMSIMHACGHSQELCNDISAG